MVQTTEELRGIPNPKDDHPRGLSDDLPSLKQFACENIPNPKRKVVSSNQPFLGAMLVLGRALIMPERGTTGVRKSSPQPPQKQCTPLLHSHTQCQSTHLEPSQKHKRTNNATALPIEPKTNKKTSLEQRLLLKVKLLYQRNGNSSTLRKITSNSTGSWKRVAL